MANYCSNCGAKAENNASYCTNCGSPLNGASYFNQTTTTTSNDILGTLVAVSLVGGITRQLYYYNGRYFMDPYCRRPFMGPRIIGPHRPIGGPHRPIGGPHGFGGPRIGGPHGFGGPRIGGPHGFGGPRGGGPHGGPGGRR